MLLINFGEYAMLSSHKLIFRKYGERKAIQGLTLVEMLVAVLVLSVGLLGIAGLQAATGFVA